MTRAEQQKFLRNKIIDILGYPVKASIVAKHYGVPCYELRELLKTNNADMELFERSCKKAAWEFARCTKCYYRGGNFTCSYPLFHSDFLKDEWVECPRFTEGTPDYDERYGCGSCKNFIGDDLFNGVCIITHEQVKSYRPSCRRWRE